MTKLAGGTIPMRALAAILLLASGAFAQLGGGSGATANQLPLSGRTGKVEFSDNPPFDLEVRGNPPVTPPARRLYYTYW